MKTLLLLLLLCLAGFGHPRVAFAQPQPQGTERVQSETFSSGDDVNENMDVVQNGDDYLQSRIRSLEQYARRAGRVQKKLLRRAKKSERGLSAMLEKRYPEAYHQYLKDDLTFDSIATLATDTASLRNKGSPVTDSLKRIQQFLQHQSARLNGASGLAAKAGLPTDYTDRLNRLQQQLRTQQQLQDLIQQRSNYLSGLLSSQNIPGAAALQKDIAIARAQIQSWKALADDPDAAEEKAWEYLEGTEGFQSYLNRNNNAFGGLGNNATAEDLQRLGYQTKAQLGQQLTQKFGSNPGAVQQQMAAQLQQYQDQLNGIKSTISEAKNDYRQARSGIAQVKQQAQHLQKPAFKNPQRGIPFIRRWHVQYSFQSTRAVDDRPAMLELSAALVYKATPGWQMGLGLSGSLGMGRDWQHLKLSYEGISLRAFLDRELLFGISLEGGYERILRPANRPYLSENNSLTGPASANNEAGPLDKMFGGQQAAAYLGLMKAYRINARWSGTFMMGYNFLWQQYNLKSPLMIRLGWEK